jgi:glycosyltransferase involved in cell wall biosynthesis
LEALEGGTARHVVDVVRHAPGIEHHVAIPSRRVGWATDELAAAQMTDAGASVHIVEMRRRPFSAHNVRAVRQLRHLMRDLEPDVVHGHSSAGGALARVAAVRLPPSCMYTPNGIRRSRSALAIERLLRRVTDTFVAVSDSEADVAVELGLSDREHLVVIPNGIDLTPVPAGDALRARLGIAADVALVGTIARLVPQKAPEVFVRACAAVATTHPKTCFVLIGSGPLQPLVEHEVRRGALVDRFHHVPFLAGASAVLGQLDVFVLASRFEGGPYTPLEAIRAGTAVVLSDAVGNRDVVEPEVSGLVVPVDDPHALARAIESLLDDPTARRAMAERAVERLHACFDVRTMGARLSQLYSELSSSTRTSPRAAARRRTLRSDAS